MRREDILIVNDGTPFLKTIGRILEDRGHRTCVTDSPDDRLAELARKYFRLVIAKVNGRAADYLGLLRGVKDLNPEARLIILGEEARLPVEAFQIEADDYILLPCRSVEVWRRLTALLKAPRAATPDTVQEKLNTINGRVLNKLNLTFHDLSSGLVSLQAACKLSRRLAQGQFEPDVDQLLKEAGERAGTLQPMLEDFLRPTLLSENLGASREFCDIREDVCEKYSGLYGFPAHADFSGMLRKTDADVVNICTPHGLHAPMAIEGARAGDHILVTVNPVP